MLHYRVAIGLLASMVSMGCGRLGFADHGDVPELVADAPAEVQVPVDDEPCTTSSFAVSENSMRAYDPRLVWNGTKAGVTWIEDPSPDSIHFRAISLGGAVGAIASPGTLAAGESVELGWDGASWRLAWAIDSPDREVVASIDGAAPRTLTANSRQDMRARVVPISGGKIAYLWVTDQPAYDLRLTVFDAAGAKLVNELAVVTGTQTLEAHNLVWTGSELVVFYVASANLMMLRLGLDGSTVAAPVVVGTVADMSSFVYAAASWVGDRFLVAWSSSLGFRIAYVSLDGALLFPAVGVAGSTLLTADVSVAVGSTSDAVAWSNINGESFVQEMSRDGKLGELHTFVDAYYPSVAWVGKRWAVALSQRVNPTPASPDPKPDYINLIQLCSAAAN